jgi:(1->4)-alpha-D-glucan 1-alpha-D-glucosylmutase
MRIFQQATSPMAAKAVEDTACYRYGRLLSRNEVGADPGHLALDIPAFHALCEERARDYPHNLLATATHDHKRGEDARARLAVLSQAAVAPLWAGTVGQWRARNASLRVSIDDAPAPSPADEYMLYQALVGAWPLQLAPDDARGLDAFLERVAQWQRKALREAKRRSRWSRPNEPYEEACERFLAALLAPGNDFATGLHAFVQRIAAAGAANGLLQATLRLTTPGVPDTYQGTEFWDFSLVDPDNRRAVDFEARRASLAADASWEELLGEWRRGPLKQRALRELLHLRARHPALFADGAYHPLAVDAEDRTRGCLLAFERRLDGRSVVVLAVRHHAGALLDAAEPRWDAEATATLAGEGRVHGLAAGRYRNVLGGQEQDVDGTTSMRDWLSPLPVAVLERL